MTEKLKAYLDGLFAGIPNTDEVREAKDELYDGMVERYEDCLREGLDEQAAYDAVVDSIGDITELIEELDLGGEAPPKSYASAGDEQRSRARTAGQNAGFDLSDVVRKITDYTSGLVSGFFNPPSGAMHLANTLRLSVAGVEDINISYVSEAIMLNVSDTDELVIKEYMNRDDPTLFAEATLTAGGIAVRHGRRSGVFGLQSEIEVFLPAAYQGSLSMFTVSGGIVTRPAWALKSLQLKTVSGEVNVGSVAADMITLGTTSGAVKAERLAGEASLRTISGGIRVESLAGCGSFSTTSGGIRVCFEALTGPVKASSISGGIRLALPEGAGIDLEAKTTSGRIHTAFDGELTFERHSRARGRTGNAPYHTVRLSSTSGSIHIND